MEYFLGSLTTLIILIVVARNLSKQRALTFSSFPKYTQSYNYELLKPFFDIGEGSLHQHRATQSINYFDSKHIKVVVMDDYAYWISGNKLWCAEFNENGVDENSTKEVDTIGMNRVELNKMITVVDKLTEGKQNDGGSPGNKKF